MMLWIRNFTCLSTIIVCNDEDDDDDDDDNDDDDDDVDVW